MYIHNLAHSLIIDPNDENQNVFMKEELQEIKEFKIKQPQASLHAQDNIVDLRKWINHIFEDLNGVEIVRTVPAVKSLKHKSMGHCGDMLIRKEYGCAEIGKIFEGENGSKLLKERGLKAPKMLKDQYCSLCKYIDYEEDKVRKFETIAFIHSGIKKKNGRRLDDIWEYVNKGEPLGGGHYKASCKWCGKGWTRGRPQDMKVHLARICEDVPENIKILWHNYLAENTSSNAKNK
ncbi:9030_t:CDS:2 [Entrophospora sp. SA101]|nr:9030_t:CDS:2 [Entrophospora sp. SA101]